MGEVRLAYLRYHWDQVYSFETVNGKYIATARFGSHDVLTADSPGELLGKIQRHYPGSTSTDLSST